MSPNGNKIKKAMILAAGLGTRLRPLTYKVPKPLLPVMGRPLVDYSLWLLKKAGVKEVVINLHHLAGQIKDCIGCGCKYNLEIHYSHERGRILGTGGGIKRAERHLKDGPFFVINPDVLADIDLKKLAIYHFRRGGAATMVVRRIRHGEDYTRVDIGRNGRLKGFGRGSYMFTGVQVLEPIIFEFLKRPSCLIESGYKKLLEAGLPVYAYHYKGRFHDVGTLDAYLGIMFKKRYLVGLKDFIRRCR